MSKADDSQDDLRRFMGAMDRKKDKPFAQRSILVGMAAVLLSVVAIVFFFLFRDRDVLVRESDISIAEVKLGKLVTDIHAAGVLVPRDVLLASSPVSGVVKTIEMQQGQDVVEGDVIVSLENDQLEQDVLNAQSAVAEEEADRASREFDMQSTLLDMESQLSSLVADARIATAQATAEKELLDRGIVTKLQFFQSKTRAEQYESKAAAFSKRLEVARRNMRAKDFADERKIASLKALEEQKRKVAEGLHVRSGLTGVVQALEVELGQSVAVGDIIARIARLEPLSARLQVPEGRSRDLAVGMQAAIDTRMGIVKAHVEKIAPTVKSGMVEVMLVIDEGLPKGARAAMGVEGRIEVEAREGVLMIPRIPGVGPGSTAHVFRLSEDRSRAQRVGIEVGAVGSDNMEVRSGLSEGDYIISTDLSSYGEVLNLRLRQYKCATRCAP